MWKFQTGEEVQEGTPLRSAEPAAKETTHPIAEVLDDPKNPSSPNIENNDEKVFEAEVEKLEELKI